MLVDTHAHLPLLTHSSLDDILERAAKEGVGKMITVSTDEHNWDSNLYLARMHTNLFFSLGLHPHDAIRWPECSARLEKYFSAGVPPKCVAIGETGLDFHYEISPKQNQVEAFESQVALANRVRLPVIIHCRDAFPDLFQSLARVGLSDRGAVLHCFTGTWEEAKEALDLGLMISFSGIVTFKNGDALRNVAAKVPADRILIETDCPFLTPTPHRGKPNEPYYLSVTAETLAAVRGESKEQFGNQTSQNAIRFFSL